MSSDPDFPTFEPEPEPDEPDIPSLAEMANDHPSAVATAMDGASSELIGFGEICVDFWDFRRGDPEVVFLLLL